MNTYLIQHLYKRKNFFNIVHAKTPQKAQEIIKENYEDTTILNIDNILLIPKYLTPKKNTIKTVITITESFQKQQKYLGYLTKSQIDLLHFFQQFDIDFEYFSFSTIVSKDDFIEY